MKILQTTQEYMKYGGLIKDQGVFNPIQIWTFFKSIAFLFLQLMYLDREADTPREYMDSIFMTAAGILIFISYASIAVQNDDIFNIIEEMENAITDRLKWVELRPIYKKTNRMVEKISRIIQFFVVFVSVPGFVLPKAVYSFFMFYTTDLGSNAFVLPIATWMPFDWRTPLGFSFAIALQLVMASFTLRYMSYMVSLGFGLYFFGLLLINGSKDSITLLDEMIRNQGTRSQLLAHGRESVRLSSLKWLAYCVVDLYQTTFAVLFLGCTACICLAMLMIQLQISTNTIDAIMLFESIFCGLWAVMLVWITCEFCEHLSTKYNEIYAEMISIEWLLLPMELRKMLLICMINAQKPLYINFFGNISCSRELFKQVVMRCYNLFMVLREVL